MSTKCDTKGSGAPTRPPGEELVEAGVLLAAELALPALLQRVVELAVRMTGARYGALGVTGPGGRIVDFITVGIDAKRRTAIGSLPSGRGILGALIRDPKPLRLARLQDDPRSAGFPPEHPPMTTFLGAPVRARGQVFGNLYLTEKAGGALFTAADEAAVVTLATQAGVAIANAQIYRELQQREQWLGALHEVTAALLAGRSTPALLEAIVASARVLAEADLAAIALVEAPGVVSLRVVAADGKGADDLLTAPSRSSGTVSHTVLRTGQAGEVRGDSRTLESSLVAAAHVPISALMVVPLKLGGQLQGTISLTLSHPGAAFAPGTLSLLESFANQASLALDYARIQARSLELAVLEERQRIARDLHDEPVQALIHLARRLEAMAADPSAIRDSAAGLEETRELAVAIVDGLGQLTEGLRSEVLERQGLAHALADLADRFSARSGIPAAFTRRGASGRWSPAMERDLLRVAQEALSNVERHAQASRVRVSLVDAPGALTLRVSDNGRGFVPGPVGGVSDGLGTMGMRERAAAHSGQLQIESGPGRGTVVRAVIPTKAGVRGAQKHPARGG